MKVDEPLSEWQLFLAHLQRGGAKGFWCFESAARKPVFKDGLETGETKPCERISVWWPVDRPAPLPRMIGPHGPRHFWFGVHPCCAIPPTNRLGEARAPKWVRSQMEYIAAVNCFYAEFDDKDFAGGKEACLAHVQHLKPATSVIIRSGGGYQCYWLYDKPTILETSEVRKAANMRQHAWVKLMGGDNAAKNLNRVLRVVGTKNVKDAYGPDYPTVEFVQCDMDKLYTLSELMTFIRPEWLQEKEHRTSPLLTYNDTAAAAMALGLLSQHRCDDHELWLAVGMNLAPLGQEGLTLWHSWSRNSIKYSEPDCNARWRSFDPQKEQGSGVGKLLRWAEDDDPIRYYALFGGNGHENGTGVNGHYTNGHTPLEPPTPPPFDDYPTEAPRANVSLVDPNIPFEFTVSIPKLPDAATVIYRFYENSAGDWLNRYTAFASRAAPMTPYSFHEAAGLFAGAVAIARRLVLKVDVKDIYPNLYLLFMAPSTLYRKTSGFELLNKLFAKAGMARFLLPEQMTPQAMVQELSLSMPQNLGMADYEAKATWLEERTFAAQRGWMIDEASSLFDSLKRDYNTGLLSLMLSLYECPNLKTEQTMGRWRTTIRDSYLSFFGASTPTEMASHIGNESHWQNGLWARFALLVPDEPTRYQFFSEPIQIPHSLSSDLRRMANLFPTPTPTLIDVEDIDGQGRRAVELIGKEPPSTVLLDEGVWRMWEAYSKALFDIAETKQVEEALYACYGRLHMQAIKIAMILATMDATTLPIRIEARHYARAQLITEKWREMAHKVRGAKIQVREETQTDKIIVMLTAAGTAGLKTRDIYRPLNIKAADGRDLLAELVKQGRIEQFSAKATNGHTVEMWRFLANIHESGKTVS